MAILTEKQTWRRRPKGEYRRPLEHLTQTESDNVRKVIVALVAEYGSHKKLAKVLGWTTNALWKARCASRMRSPRVTYAIARLLDVGVDHVLAGRWHKVTCPCCGQTITV